MRGFIAVDRGIFEHKFFDAEPFTQREAWIWLVSEAAWRECVVKTKFGAVSISRGQCIYSVRFLAEKWKWDRSRVYRFLRALVDANSIRTASEHGMQQITICNYEKYQGARTENEQETNSNRDKEEQYNHRTKDKEVDAASPPAAAQVFYLDDRARLFGEGRQILDEMGIPESRARPLIGKLLKQCGDDCAGVLRAIFAAREKRPADLPSFLFACVKPKEAQNAAPTLNSVIRTIQAAAKGHSGGGSARAPLALGFLPDGKAQRSGSLRDGDCHVARTISRTGGDEGL